MGERRCAVRRVAVLLLSAVGFIPGCGLTQSLWLDVREKPSRVQSVHLSPDGSVCIVYTVDTVKAQAQGVSFGTPMGPSWGGTLLCPTGESYARGIVLPRAHMDKVLARASGRRSVEMGHEELAEFVRPRSPASRKSFDPASVPGYGKDWVEVPVSQGEPPTRSSLGKPPTFSYPRRARGEGTASAGGAEMITVRLLLPERSTMSP
jgi:hypothetical protein